MAMPSLPAAVGALGRRSERGPSSLPRLPVLTRQRSPGSTASAAHGRRVAYLLVFFGLFF
jgi:hypothetical protein